MAPAAPPYLAQLQRYPGWLAGIGVAGFALVDPVWEELLFRRVVLEDLTASWGQVPPSSSKPCSSRRAPGGVPLRLGRMLMAAGWGLVLGVLRLRTGGILVPYLVHVTANVVIGSLAVLLL